MKITKSQLKQIIKEEISKILKEAETIDSGEPQDLGNTSVKARDGQEHTLVITGVLEYDDDTGVFSYTIGKTEYEWDLSSGYHEAGAADDIMQTLGYDPDDEDDEQVMQTQQQLKSWLEGLDLSARYSARRG